jgi:hypothetical protein
VDETNVNLGDDDDKTVARLTGLYNRRPLDTGEDISVVATDKRSLISMKSSWQNITLVPEEPVDSLAHIQGIVGEGTKTRVVFELFFHADGDSEAARVSFTVLIDGYSLSIFFDTSSYSNGDNIDGNIYTILDLIVEQTGTTENATVDDVDQVNFIAGDSGWLFKEKKK